MPVILSIEYTIAREAKEFHIVAGVADNESSRSWVDLGSVIFCPFMNFFISTNVPLLERVVRKLIINLIKIKSVELLSLFKNQHHHTMKLFNASSLSSSVFAFTAATAFTNSILGVSGHGYMFQPSSRNYYSNINGKDYGSESGVPIPREYCYHCLNTNTGVCGTYHVIFYNFFQVEYKYIEAIISLDTTTNSFDGEICSLLYAFFWFRFRFQVHPNRVPTTTNILILLDNLCLGLHKHRTRWGIPSQSEWN